MIPRILHQIWLGPDPLPAEFAGYVETWKRNHPDWVHHLWTEDTLPEGLRPEVYERLRVPAERSDILRLELLLRHGGVYVDTDFECLRALDPLLDGVDLFAAYYKDPETVAEAGIDNRTNNAILGASPGHPLISRALAEIAPRSTWGLVDKERTGPFFMDRLLKESEATLFEQRLFYPKPYERDEAYAYHHMARTWKDEAGMRRSARLARSRSARARDELRELEARLRLLERGDRSRGAAARHRLVWYAFRTRRDVERALARSRYKAGRAREEARKLLTPTLHRLRARAAARSGRRGDVLVPRTIHHIWLGGTLPADARKRIETWRLAHPDWELRLWTDADVPDDAQQVELREPLRSPAERADLLRLEILLRHGGVVVDPALRCRRRLDPLVAGSTCFASADPDGAPRTLVLGATPRHPALTAMLEEVRPREWHGHSDAATGGGALARALAGGAEIDLVPDEKLRRVAEGVSSATAENRLQLLADVRDAEHELGELDAEVRRLRAEVARLEPAPASR